MGKIEYIRAFNAGATQLNSRMAGREWCEADVPLADAIAWANLGYTPEGAAPLIASGISPQMAADADEAGGSIEERIARLADAGIGTTGVDLSALD